MGTKTHAAVVDLEALDATQVGRAGAKGANLGELSRIEGVRVPRGFVVTADAFRRDLVIDDDLAAAIRERVAPDTAYAVRSSATAEDSPTASFAGQHDTYLDVVGADAVLAHVARCWGSLFTDRAVAYRAQQGLDDGDVVMAVVVQEMVAARASGVLFTADPLTSNRTVTSIEAVFGLGEALVSGRATPDTYTVRQGAVVEAEHRQEQPVLTEVQVVRLAQLGRHIEAHFGRPQDIEWCLTQEGDFVIVQSRPITTLYPIPVRDDDQPRVYVSVGHQQMMTDPMKPLGMSLWQLTAAPPMHEAGGRLFVDITQNLASPATRDGLVQLLGEDPLIGSALRSLLDRDFIPLLPDDGTPPRPHIPPSDPIETDSRIVETLIAENEASVATLRAEITKHSGPELLDFIKADIGELQRLLWDPRNRQVYMPAMAGHAWLNEKLGEWLGEKNPADTLTLSVDHNVTSEMGLALLDVADVIRRDPAAVAVLEQADGDDFVDALPTAARDALQAYLDQYGMRCIGEIDVTRPRWSEQPSALIPMLLGNVRTFEPGEAERRFERGLEQARAFEQDVLERLRALPDGAAKAEEAKQVIDRVRTFIGYREYPKYGIVARYLVYKRALLAEADRLVAAGVLAEREDSFYLRFEELQEVARTHTLDPALIAARKAAFAFSETLTPPRVLTSEGETVIGTYNREGLPADALVGVAVSAGTVEGRARVVLDVAGVTLEPGDILVTGFTDPSWSPLFVAAAGLVTEVGGVMSHGAVVAREYGLPAVVGVERATRLIPDGARIRVHGTDGYVELL